MNRPGSMLADVIERNRDDERRRALRALLAEPLLLRAHPAYPLVRKHAKELRQWFAHEAGWELQVEDSFARLRKQAGNHSDSTRAARLDSPPGSPPFSRRRYALLCLALADLEKGETQITLGRLGDAAVSAANEATLESLGMSFSLTTRDDRRDLVAVVRLLLSIGVLQRVAGDEILFVRSRERDVLYDVNRRLLAILLVANRGASQVEQDLDSESNTDARIAAITQRFVPDTADARNTEIRRRLTARLLDDPTLYWDELDSEETSYLKSQRHHIARRIHEAAALVDEHRAEGMAMVDPVGDLTDIRLPSEGTDGHATLLVADLLSRRREPVTLEELAARMRNWVQNFRKYWRKAAAEPGAETELVRTAVERLCALRLARLDRDAVVPLPAIGRHALGETTVSESQGQLL